MRTNGVATNTFTPTIRASTDTYGALDSDIYRYWYFEHLGNNEYVIRSMANKSQLLTITSSSLTSTIVTLREYSGSYPTNARWIISRGSYGYVLVNKAKSMSLRVNPSNSLSYVSNALYSKGAHYVLGTTMFTIPYYANLFTKNFLSEMNAGISVGEAIYNAAREQSYICVDDNGTWQYLDVLPYYDAGDRIQRFNY